MSETKFLPRGVREARRIVSAMSNDPMAQGFPWFCWWDSEPYETIFWSSIADSSMNALIEASATRPGERPYEVFPARTIAAVIFDEYEEPKDESKAEVLAACWDMGSVATRFETHTRHEFLDGSAIVVDRRLGGEWGIGVHKTRLHQAAELLGEKATERKLWYLMTDDHSRITSVFGRPPHPAVAAVEREFFQMGSSIAKLPYAVKNEAWQQIAEPLDVRVLVDLRQDLARWRGNDWGLE